MSLEGGREGRGGERRGGREGREERDDCYTYSVGTIFPISTMFE